MKRDVSRWILGLLLSGLLAFPIAPGRTSSSTDRRPARMPGAVSRASAGARLVVDAYGRLPISFEPNQGQTDRQVLFTARARGYRLFLTASEAVLVPAHARGLSAIRMRMVRANPSPAVLGEAPLPGRVNYFIGSDPAQWRSGVPTYAKVRYRAVYPGVDLVYYSRQGQLEYDFVVAAGADPARIRLTFAGAESLDVDAAGDLILGGAGGEIRMHRPRVYQEQHGREELIDAAYVVRDREVGFRLGAYDPARPLVIDPALTYSTFLGGSSNDHGRSIVVDAAGNAYVTGDTTSANFPTASPLQGASGGVTDAFVTKINAAGSALIYSTYLGGSSHDWGYGIALDGVGNAYVGGTTWSANFPTTMGAFDTTFNGVGDAFVAKLNAAGSALLYSTFLGGSIGGSDGFAIAVDAMGSAYVTGRTRASNFPTTMGAFDTVCGSASPGICADFDDAFVTKFNAAGSALVYSTYLGGSGNTHDYAYAIAVDGMGSAYVTGITYSPDWPLMSPIQAVYGGAGDAYATKLNAAGSALVYSTYLGGSAFDQGNGITLDGSANAYVTGETNSANFPTASTFQAAIGANDDAFVTKINAAGSALVYSTYLGGNNLDRGRGIAVNAAGESYVAMWTASNNLPTVIPVQGPPVSIGCCDVYVARFNAAGSALRYATYLGGASAVNDDQPRALALDAAGRAYVTGQTFSADFPTTPGAFDTSQNAGYDAFIVRFSPSQTVGVYNPGAGVWYLRNTNSAGPADVVFGYGPGGLGWLPVAGDWDGNGTVTPGVYNPMTGVWYLRNSNTAGPADVVFGYGPGGLGWLPIVGDWDGNGTDTAGVYDPMTGVWYLRNTNTAGPADVIFGYGPGGLLWKPIPGDWDGNGTDTAGVYDPATGVWYLRNTNTAGPADVIFGYGPGGLGWLPVPGDWNGDGATTPGVYNPMTGVWYLRNTNTGGPAEVVFGYGPGGLGWAPIAGDWDNL